MLFALGARYPTRMRRSRETVARRRLAIGLRFKGRKRKHDAAEMMCAIVARCLVEHLEQCGFVVMNRSPMGGDRALG
jgi:hypothetical protein